MLLSDKIMKAWMAIIDIPHQMSLEDFVVQTLNSLYYEKYHIYPERNKQGEIMLRDCYYKIQYECEEYTIGYNVTQKLFMGVPVTSK